MHQVGRERYLMRPGNTYQFKPYPESRGAMDGLTTHALNYTLYGTYGPNNQF